MSKDSEINANKKMLDKSTLNKKTPQSYSATFLKKDKKVALVRNALLYNEKNINTLYYLNRYQEHYKKIICTDFLYKKNYKNIFEIPKIEKIILSITSKNIISDKKNIIPGLISLELISGQKVKQTSARKSIASFKLRKNQLIGCKTDLRNKNLYHFLEKLVTIILPRIRQFNGINIKVLNEKTHVTLGLSEILVFPELENYFEYFEFLKGVTITIVSNLNKKKSFNNEKKNQSLFLTFLSGFQFPVK